MFFTKTMIMKIMTKMIIMTKMFFTRIMMMVMTIQVNTATPAGLTPLMLACLREDVAVVSFMIIINNFPIYSDQYRADGKDQ